MRDYKHTWPGQETPIPTSQIPTRVIYDLLEYLREGLPVDNPDGDDMEGVRQRLVLELEIRAMGLSSE